MVDMLNFIFTEILVIDDVQTCRSIFPAFKIFTTVIFNIFKA